MNVNKNIIIPETFKRFKKNENNTPNNPMVNQTTNHGDFFLVQCNGMLVTVIIYDNFFDLSKALMNSSSFVNLATASRSAPSNAVFALFPEAN